MIGLISLGGQSDQIRRAVAKCNENTRFNPYRFFYDSVEQTLEKYQAIKVGGEVVAEDVIRFVSNQFITDTGDYGRAWVGSLEAAELKRLYETHGEKLFARNVRLFLGTRKGGINEQIVTTAKASPGKFWALNNGITIVADTIKPEKDGGFRLNRFSIVNGCQTTVSIHRAGAPTGAKVLTRVVAANQAVVNEIVRYNNTQNAVQLWTVRAADPVHQRLRAAFSTINVDYAPKPDTRRVGKRTETVIQIDRLAQYLASRGDTLIDAVNAKSELFDRHYQSIFPQDITPEDAYLAWVLGVLADEARQERIDSLKAQGDADKDQLSLLGVAGTFWTVHCASKLVSALNSSPMRLGLRSLRAEQVQNALRKYVAEALDIYLDMAIDAFDPAEHGSIRQALKLQKFLQKVDQKLVNKVARLKQQKKLPPLDVVVKSAGIKAG